MKTLSITIILYFLILLRNLNGLPLVLNGIIHQN